VNEGCGLVVAGALIMYGLSLVANKL